MLRTSLLVLCAIVTAAAARPAERSFSPHARLHAVEPGGVRWTEGFWAGREELVRQRTMPVILKAIEDPTADHGGFHKSAANVNAALDVFAGLLAR